MGWCLSYIIGGTEIEHEMDLVEVVYWGSFFCYELFQGMFLGEGGKI